MKQDRRYRTGIFKTRERKHRWSLTLIFSAVVFIILLLAIALTVGAVYLLLLVGVIGDIEGDIDISLVILLMSLISLVLGSVIVFFTSKFPLRPINNLINKMREHNLIEE